MSRGNRVDHEIRQSGASHGSGASPTKHEALPESIRAVFGAAILVIAPAVMLAGLLYHPHLGNPTDADFLANLAAAVEADPLRWGVAHYLVAVGSGLLALAFLALRAWLGRRGEERWSAIGLPFVVMGSVLYALLPAMEFAPLSAVSIGADAAAIQNGVYPWFIPTLFGGAFIFAIGACAFAVAIVRSGLLPGRSWTRLVAGAIVVMALARFAPIGFVQMHVQAFAGIAALWPLAYHLSKRSAPATASSRFAPVAAE